MYALALYFILLSDKFAVSWTIFNLSQPKNAHILSTAGGFKKVPGKGYRVEDLILNFYFA